MVIGGTGLLGFHAILAGLKKGHSFGALAIDDVELGGWFPEEVSVHIGDVFEMTAEQLKNLFTGYDGIVYAVGPDDRVVPPAPAYDFFHKRLVGNCEKTLNAAREAGVKRCAVLNSYFAYFDRLWPALRLSERHPYIKCRTEQANSSIAAGADSMEVMILELPYIFGSMPGRVPLWKEVFLDKYTKGKTIYFPRGGTNMIAARNVGEAVIGALERGQHGTRYPIGDENHTFNEMLEMMMSAIGEKKRIVNIPRFIAALAGRMIERSRRKQGLEGGLNASYLMQDILTRELYYDASETAEALGYGQGGLEESITETMKACYPEKFI
jgi:nucleoside-diphosphate-sugar epimerase